MLTEKPNSNTLHLHQMSALEIVQTMNSEDATIAQAVREAQQEIASAVELITERLRKAVACFTWELVQVGAWECWMLQNVHRLSEHCRRWFKA